jgi:dsDNA-specific endonuclease/ATPase MutS2
MREYQAHQKLKKNYSDYSSFNVDSVYYELDLEKIKNAEDLRTCLMVRNIPNKYSQNELIYEVNRNNQGRYDFVYLPIDYTNDANVGYAFINFVHPLFILDFFTEFNGYRWQRYKSPKIC